MKRAGFPDKTDTLRWELTEDLLDEAKERYEAEGQKVRLLAEGTYQPGSWQRRRRVLYNAEATEKGTNTRHLVSTSRADPEALYGFYARHGESENWIKDFKLHITRRII